MSNDSVAFVNLLRARPGKQEALVALLKQSTDTIIRTVPGWKSTHVVAENNGDAVVVYSEWETTAAIEAMRVDPRMVDLLPEITELASVQSMVGSTAWGRVRERHQGMAATARMVVIYKTPPDVNAFTKHYFEKHLPLAKRIPGLRKYEISRGPVMVVAGSPDVHLVGTLHYDDLDAMKAAFASPEGQAAAADRRLYAPDASGVQMLLFNSQEV